MLNPTLRSHVRSHAVRGTRPEKGDAKSMKSFFNKLGTSSAAPKKAAPTEEELQKQLTKTQTRLAELARSKSENFPLLNDTTRQGESCVISRHCEASLSHRRKKLGSNALQCKLSMRACCVCRRANYAPSGKSSS